MRKFQEIFNLTVDGIVGKATWYKIKQVFAAVKQLSELTGEGLTISEVERRYTRVMSPGDSGADVEALQYYLAFLGYFYPELPPISITGFFDDMTRDAVFSFEKFYGLPINGIVDANTFYKIEDIYKRAVSELPPSYQSAIGEPYPGRFFFFFDSGESVRIIQGYLSKISQTDPDIPNVEVTGTYDEATKNAVIKLQAQLGIEQNGAVGPVEWAEIIIRGNNL